MKKLFSILALLLTASFSIAQSVDAQVDSLQINTAGPYYGGQNLSLTVHYSWDSAASLSFSYYLSEDSVFSTSDALLETVTVNGQGSPISNSQQVILPVTGSGDKYLLVVANAQLTIFETDFGNNQAHQAISISERPLADVRVRSLGLPVTTYEAGATMTGIRAVLEKTGTLDTGIGITLFASKDDSYDTDDEPLYSMALSSALFTGDSLVHTFSAQIPAATDTAVHYLIAYIDSQNTQMESDEGNNALAKEITVNPIPQPDLLPNEILAPDSVKVSGIFEVGVRLLNQGQANASFTYATLYLSKDEVFSNDDYVFEQAFGPVSLAANQNQQILANLLIPSYIEPGAYFLVAVADPDQSYQESDETNNFFTRAIQVDAADVADFAFTDFAPVQSTLDAGSLVDVDFTIRNEGTRAEVFNSVSIYLSSDSTLSDSDVFMKDFTSGAIVSPGSSFSAQSGVYNLRFPATLSEGAYQVWAVINENRSTQESNYSNNDTLYTINIRTADATAENGSIDKGFVGIGESFSLQFDYKNIDTVALLPSAKLSYYFSSDSAFSAVDDIPLFSQAQSQTSLAATGTRTINQSLVMPNAASSGKRYIAVVIDEEGLVAEDNEQNNVLLVPLDVKSPDLLIQDFTLNPIVVDAEGNTNMEFRLKNAGQVASGAFSVDFYISEDEQLDENDSSLGSETFLSLGPDSLSNTLSRQIAIPTLEAGNYSVLALVDARSVVEESNESNNGAITNMIVENADLIFVNVELVKETLEIGKADTINFNIRNQGQAIAQDFNYTLSLINEAGDYEFELDSRSIVSLEGDGVATSRQEWIFNVPSNFPGTKAIVRLQVDSDSTVVELDETNNIALDTITLILPDLLIKNELVSPTTVDVGFSTTVSYTVENIGDSRANSGFVEFYVSSNTTFEAENDAFVDKLSLPSLDKAKSENFSFNLNFPSDLSPGTFNLIYFVDGAEQISEKNENNNIVSEPITIRVGDLTVSSATTDKDTVAVNETFRVTAKVKNESTSATVPSSKLYVYLSDQPTLTNANTVFYYLDVPQLSSTQTSADLVLDINLASNGIFNLPPGTYYVLFEADGTKSITETNENNNVRPLEIIIQGPDLLPINLLSSKQRYDQGEAGSIEFDIRNNGRVAASGNYYGIYLSKTDSVTEESIFLANNFINGVNAQSSSSTINESFILNTTLEAGDYFLLVVADYYESIGEVNEDNNTASVAISIKSPDLRSENLSLSEDTVSLDQTTVLTFDISNLGDGRAVASSANIRIRPVESDTSYSIGNVNTNPILAAAKATGQTFNWRVSLQQADTGYNYLYIAADGFNQVIESNEENNLDSILIYINPYDVAIDTALVSPAQLEEEYLSTQNSVYLRSLIRYSYLQSTDISPAVYLSSDASLDSQDSLLATDYINQSNSGGIEQANVGIYVPANLSAGMYYLIFEVDPSNLLKEKDEVNNRMAIPLQVGAPLLPDLRLRQVVSLPPVVASGRTTLASTVIDNNGAANAPNSRLSYYLSTNETLDGGDPALLSNRSVAALARADQHLLSDTLSIPASTTAGDYFILAKIDASDSIAETMEDNNLFAVPIKVRDPLSVDMAITFAGRLPEAVSPGEAFTTVVEIQNLGLALAIEEQTVAAYLSSDEALSDADVALFSTTRSQVSPYDRLSDELVLSIPASTSPGNYFLLLRVDDGEVFTEPNEVNNLSVLPLTVSAPLAPDISWIQLSTSTLNPNTEFSLQAQLRNIGGSFADDLLISFYLSANGLLGDEDLLLGTLTEAVELGRFEEALLDTILFLPPSVAEGRYFIYATIDQLAGETNYENNLFVQEVQVGTPQIPDFETYFINSVISYTNEIGSESTQVSVRNNGNLSETATISVYLSTNEQVDASDPLLASSELFLAAGGSYSVNLNLSVPSNTAVGDYFMIAVVNESEVIYEDDYSNNSVLGSFQMNPPSQADFALSSLILSRNAINANTIVDVSYRLTNSDRLGASDVEVSFYLSTDEAFTTSDRLIDTQTIEDIGGNSSLNLAYPLFIPEDVAEGDYFFFAVADPSNAFNESLEDNNTINQAVIILEAVRPDFSLQVNSASNSQAANTAFTLDYSLFNFTLAGANNVEVEIYLSSDNQVDEADVLLSQDLISIVRENSSNRRFVEIYIPSDQASGNYQLLLVADPQDKVTETNEGNNVLGRNLAITQAVLPDLAINQINSSLSVQAGDLVYFQLQLANLAAGYAASSSINVSLQSTDITYDLATISLGEVPGFVSGTLDSLLAIPLEVAAGTYDLLVTLDANNEVEESNEDNNSFTRALTVIAPPAHDLRIDNASLSRSDLSTSTSASLTVNVSNAGANLAPETQVRVFLSEDSNLDASDLAVLSLSVPRLEPAQSQSLNGTVAILESYQALGAHTLILVLDADALSNDANRDNNVSSLSITIEEPLGIHTLRNALSVYPNPVDDRLMIDSKMPLRLVQVIDANGRKILEEERASTQIQLATDTWKPGVYLVLLTDESGQTARVRILKQ